jgi:hypothetical protein
MWFEATVQHEGGLVELTHLQEQLRARDLGDVEEIGEPSLQRVGDDAVGGVEGVVGAIEREECGCAPQPGQELIEPVRLRDAVAKNASNRSIGVKRPFT